MLRNVALAAATGGSMSPAHRPVATSITRKLREALKPTVLDVVDESHQHAGHAGNPSGDPNAETHFRVKIVSEEFKGKRLIQRHQAVYRLLDEELKGSVHALSIDAKSPEEGT